MKAKQMDVVINFYKEEGYYEVLYEVAKAIPLECELREDIPGTFLGYCDKRNHWQNEMIDGCCFCRGINIWTNKCLCIYDGEYKKEKKK